jgi:trigger factor
VKAENIQVTDEKLEEELQKMAGTYKMDISQVKSRMGEQGIKQMREDLAVQEAVDFLVAEAKLV